MLLRRLPFGRKNYAHVVTTLMLYAKVSCCNVKAESDPCLLNIGNAKHGVDVTCKKADELPLANQVSLTSMS